MTALRQRMTMKMFNVWYIVSLNSSTTVSITHSVQTSVAVLGKFKTHKILSKASAKLSTIFPILPEHFCQNFEITIFAEILNIVAKFRKDSIFCAEIFVKLSLKY